MAQHQSRAMRNFMRYVSLFGDWPSHIALGLLLLGIAWIRDSKKWMRIFLAMLVAMSIAGVTGHVIKRTIPRPRPSVKTEIHWGGSRFSSKYHSFPSGHVGASTAFFCTLFLANRRIGLACSHSDSHCVFAHASERIICPTSFALRSWVLCARWSRIFVCGQSKSPIANRNLDAEGEIRTHEAFGLPVFKTGASTALPPSNNR